MSRFKVAAVFSSNMVLQRNKPVSVFGEACDGSKIKISIKYPENGDFRENSVVIEAVNGKWEGILPAMRENRNCSVTVECGEESRVFENVAIGEVWLAGGQSNMEFELQNIKGGYEHLTEDKPDVRFYYTQKNGYMDDTFFENESKMCWKEFDSESAKCWSGVGYLFAKRLSESLGVTVGVIGCNWGGTSASAWMSEEAIKEDADTNTYLTEYYEKIAGKTEEEQIKEYREYEAYTAEWEKKAGEVYAVTPNIGWDELQEKIGPNKWPGPMNCINPFRPAGLYKCMLDRVSPYTLRGFLFYQGESDDHKPAVYYKLFSRMIKQWRDDWRDETLPFLFVQLPGHRYAADPDYKHWCLIREAQNHVSEAVDNTGMAVIIECGEFNEIHPKDKEPVAERLYRQAMAKVYGLMTDDEAEGPAIENVAFDGNKAEVIFGKLGGGLVVKGDRIEGFELAGDDMVFYPAEAEIKGNSVTVKSEKTEKPKYLRYLWTNYPEKVTLYGKNGIPAAPYRSSISDGETLVHETNIQQIMEL